MTIRECYTELQGNYDDALSRLMSDRLVEKFMLKFLQDGTMQQLRDALAARDYEAAFRAVHTLKGVAANLSFTGLQAAASELTEFLRADKKEPDAAAVQKLESSYLHTVRTLQAYKEDHCIN